jgi:oxygen-dependent protoporphyrinogen oxidase
MKRVLIVGGGIAGLSCAYELHKAGWPVTIVEKGRLGGVILTERSEGYLIEGGPDSFITTKPWAKELCEEIGLGDRLMSARARGFHVLWEGKLHPVPDGVFLAVPTRLWPFLASGLFSLGGKFRMAMDLILPRGPEMEDESIGAFVRRRLGREALEKLAEPVMAGIYVASADELSLRATFPRFAEMEREHRSLIRALRRAPPSGPTSPFVTLRGGMRELVDRLVSRMTGVTFVGGREVVALEPGWRVRLDGSVMEADVVVLAVPGPCAARLWAGVPAIRHVSTATVSLGYRGRLDLDGTGHVIPRSQRKGMVACTWTSSKFEGRAPADRTLIRCFYDRTDGDLARRAHEELREVLPLGGEPEFARAFTWPDASPVYEVGHIRRVEEFEARLPPGLHVAGAGFHGIGIPDCIRDGRAVARRILAALT